MALQIPAQMTARTQVMRENYRENRVEYRQILRYAGYGLAVVILARIIITVSQHVSALVPAGMVAALIFSAFELALTAAGLIIAAITLAAVVGLGLTSILRLVGLRR